MIVESLVPQTLDEYKEFIEKFENCTLPKDRWLHGAHLLVALWYLSKYDDDALILMREGIVKYNVSTGGRNTETEGYHETITVFWIRIVRGFLKEKGSERPLEELAGELISTYSFRKNFFREYYSFDIMSSREARRRWVSPDLKQLP